MKKFELPFEEKYSYDYSKIYYWRHKKGLLKRLSNFLEQRMIAKSLLLAGSPRTVLDLPCGAGRFLNTILKNGVTEVIAADKSAGMLQVIKESFSRDQLSQVKLMQTEITKIDLPDNAVDSVFCIRLLHHIHDPAYRQAIYQELKRVSRDTVCISYWVDGNYKSYRESLRAKRKQTFSRCLNQEYLENELISAGFSIVGAVDMLKFFHYWRMYVLKV